MSKEIKLLFDSVAVDESYSTGWGLSCLIDGTVLFDTGESGEQLLKNMIAMNVDVNRIETIVISHEHWDHIDGLWDILRQRSAIDVYVCPQYSDEFKAKIKLFGGRTIESNSFMEIKKGMWISGEMDCLYKNKPMPEQALIIKSKKGISIVTGCSHPGIITIIERVKEIFQREEMYCVIGGFHLKDSSEEDILHIVRRFKELEVQHAFPIHCSGDVAKKLFAAQYGAQIYDMTVGQCLEL